MTTRKNKPKVAQSKSLSRFGLVSDWDLSLHAWSTKEKYESHWKRTDGLQLTVRGSFTEEVSGATQFRFLIYPADDLGAQRTTVPFVGSFFRAKPILEAAVPIFEPHFQAMVSVAATGKLAALHVTFERLRYGSGTISSMILDTSNNIE